MPVLVVLADPGVDPLGFVIDAKSFDVFPQTLLLLVNP
jgi:hypothetical protein